MGASHVSGPLFVSGVPTMGAGNEFFTTGNVFFVDSGSAGASDNSIKGKTVDEPFATLDFAVGQCTANNGDLIIVMPGHAETITADSGVDIDVAGVTVIGVGKGAARPTFTFTTAVTADFKLAANSTHVENLVFLGGIDATTGVIEISGTDCSLINCEYRDSTGQAVDVVTTVNNADRLLIDGLRVIGAAAAGGASAIFLNGCDDAIIRNCDIYGNFSVAAIDFRTTASARTAIYNCKIWTENAADLCIKDTITGSTGVMGPKLYLVLQDDAANITGAITGATFYVMDDGVQVVNAVNEKSLAINWDASADL